MDFIRNYQLNMMLALSSICAVIIFFVSITKYISKEKKKSLLIMTISALVLLMSDRYAYYFRGDTTLFGYYMVRISNYLVFAMSLSIIYGFNNYLISFHNDNSTNSKVPKILKYIKILIIIGHILLIISQFTNLYYSFDTDNYYHREKGFLICYIIPLISLLLLSVVVLMYHKRTKKRIFIPLILFTVLPIITSIIQIFTYGLSLTNITCSGVVIIIYASTIYDANILKSEKEKIENELQVARDIQLNECPNEFPAFPLRKEFDLYAIMNAAKEVGGDFYDYFLIDDNHLALVIADVSGKGVPAALNMVKAKILLKGIAKYIHDPAKILTSLNNSFTDNNKLDMFVTILFGIIDLTTGKLKFANAGHEDLIIYDENKGFDILKTKHDIPIGAISNYQYKNHEVTLNKGNKLFLYTDGILDAVDRNNKQFGIDNLLKTLNKYKDNNTKKITEYIMKTLENYREDRQQFDDITMLCFELTGENKHNNKISLKNKFKVDLKEIDNVYKYFTPAISNVIGKEKIKEFYITIDEIFSNIVKYGFKNIDKDDYVQLELIIDSLQRNIKIIFEDNGIPFNPLENNTPDINLSADERKEGGLGIFIVKKMMDKVSYKYKNNKNILTIEKKY